MNGGAVEVVEATTTRRLRIPQVLRRRGFLLSTGVQLLRAMHQAVGTDVDNEMTRKTIMIDMKCRNCRNNLHDIITAMDKHKDDEGDAVLLTLTFEDGELETMSGQSFWHIVSSELTDN